MKKFTLFIAALFLGGIMYAQNNVSGVVVDDFAVVERISRFNPTTGSETASSSSSS